jgi:hypothetical protein
MARMGDARLSFKSGVNIGVVAVACLILVACGGGSSGDSSSSGGKSSSGSSSGGSVAAPTVALSASPTSIAGGSTSMLQWSSTDASSCTASGGWTGSMPTAGTQPTSALTVNTSYTLSCTGAGGTASATASVAIIPTVSLSAAPSCVAAAGASTLTWTSTNASSCTASAGWTGSEPTAGSHPTGALSASTTYTLTCSGAGGTSSPVSAAVAVTAAITVSVAPAFAPLTLSQTQQFTATVSGCGGGANWSVDGIAGGNASVGTITASGLYRPGTAVGTHTILESSTANSAQSGSATVAVTDLAGVYTFHNDAARTGQNLQEYALTPANVASPNFGKLWSCPVDGDVYAQPLYVANLTIGGGVHNVLFIATEHDSVYAFDADNASCVPYWQTSALTGGATTVPVSDTGSICADILVEYGITGTPVIDPVTQTIYFVANTKLNGNWYQSLHRLSLATGAEQAGSPVTIQASVTNQSQTAVNFAPLWNNQRPALALTAGNVYIGWSSHCDIGDPNQSYNFWGWLLGYNAATLAQSLVFNVAPNGTFGGIWMSGDAPALDSSGSLFLSTGNGTFDDTVSQPLPPLPPNSDFAMSFLKLNPSTLAVEDFYTPSMEATWSNNDQDISSGGVTVIPDGMGPSGHPNLLVGSDKQGHLWLVDRSAMSEFNASADNTVEYLSLPLQYGCSGPCVSSTPGYYNGTVYTGMSNNPLMAFPLTNGLIPDTTGPYSGALTVAAAASESAEYYGYPSPTPSISASPTGNAIVWVLDDSANHTDSGHPPNLAPLGPAVLRAYDATNLSMTLYSSSKLASDAAGNAVKFVVPVVANGHVYVAGSHLITIYGLNP